jgi:hypothetical protein
MTTESRLHVPIFPPSFFKEFAIGLAIAIYPACKIKQIATYAFSDDYMQDIESQEDAHTLSLISTATATLAALQIAYIGQRILGLLKKRKLRPLFVTIMLTAPTWIEGYSLLKKKLEKYQLTPIQSKLATGILALTSTLFIHTLTKKVL